MNSEASTTSSTSGGDSPTPLREDVAAELDRCLQNLQGVSVADGARVFKTACQQLQHVAADVLESEKVLWKAALEWDYHAHLSYSSFEEMRVQMDGPKLERVDLRARQEILKIRKNWGDDFLESISHWPVPAGTKMTSVLLRISKAHTLPVFVRQIEEIRAARCTEKSGKRGRRRADTIQHCDIQAYIVKWLPRSSRTKRLENNTRDSETSQYSVNDEDGSAIEYEMQSAYGDDIRKQEDEAESDINRDAVEAYGPKIRYRDDDSVDDSAPATPQFASHLSNAGRKRRFPTPFLQTPSAKISKTTFQDSRSIEVGRGNLPRDALLKDTSLGSTSFKFRSYLDDSPIPFSLPRHDSRINLRGRAQEDSLASAEYSPLAEELPTPTLLGKPLSSLSRLSNTTSPSRLHEPIDTDGLPPPKFELQPQLSSIDSAVQSLKSHGMLNDDAINSCLQLVHKSSKSSVVLLTSYVLQIDKDSPGTTSARCRSRQPEKALDADSHYRGQYLLPLHHTSPLHWTTALVDFDRKTVHHYDSLLDQDRFNKVQHHVCCWMSEKGLAGPPSEVTCYSEKDCPQQRDTVSCGLYMLAFASALLLNQQIPFIVDPGRLRSLFLDVLLKGSGSEAESQTVISKMVETAPLTMAQRNVTAAHSIADAARAARSFWVDVQQKAEHTNSTAGRLLKDAQENWIAVFQRTQTNVKDTSNLSIKAIEETSGTIASLSLRITELNSIEQSSSVACSRFGDTVAKYDIILQSLVEITKHSEADQSASLALGELTSKLETLQKGA